MRDAKIRLLFAVFCYFLFSKRQFVLRELIRRLNLQGSHILTHILAFVSDPQTTPRTANMCGNRVLKRLRHASMATKLTRLKQDGGAVTIASLLSFFENENKSVLRGEYHFKLTNV